MLKKKKFYMFKKYRIYNDYLKKLYVTDTLSHQF